MNRRKILSNSEISAFCGQLSLIVKAGISLQEGLLIMAEDDKNGRGGEIIEKLTDVMHEIGMTEGFDIGLEMSGSQPGLSDMIHNMKHGGKIALLGLQRQDATVDLETVIFNGLNIRGIYGRKVWDTWYKMSTMIQAGLDISPIITHHFDIRDYEKGFEAMISGQSGKVILDWAHIND